MDSALARRPSRPGTAGDGDRRRARVAVRVGGRLHHRSHGRELRIPRLAAVVEFAAPLLPEIAPGIAAPVPVRSSPGELAVVATRGLGDGHLVEHVHAALDRPGSVGVIATDDQVGDLAALLVAAGIEHLVLPSDDDARLTVVPATLAKGLEFDHVVVVEPSRIVAAESRGLRRLYVALTRAVSSLAVVHADPLPHALRHHSPPR